jgi:predicted GTPase
MNRDAPPPRNVLILGAAGRDYHLFNTVYRRQTRAANGADASGADGYNERGAPAASEASLGPAGANGGGPAPDPSSDRAPDRVVCFTHAQIPFIESKAYPAALCGAGYPRDGIPIVPERDLEAAVAAHGVRACVFAYSDVSHEQLGALSARVRRAGCDFVLPAAGAGGPGDPSTLRSTRPVVAVTAVRTGCGKSQVCARVAEAARSAGVRVALVRHPMPYGDLERMRVQRFASLTDLDTQGATVEEREEYEQHLERGVVVFAGVDYGAILREAEKEADVIIFDGGNNDTPFYRPDLDLCVCDPFRPRAHETHYPGGINFARAGHLVVNKANTAPREGVAAVLAAAVALNPAACVYVTDSRVTLRLAGAAATGAAAGGGGTGPEGGAAEKSAATADANAAAAIAFVRGKRALCVDDGPTITHGGLATGAAVVAAREAGCAEVVDPRPFFRGAVAEALAKYPHIGLTVPALGYGPEQVRDLAATIRAAVSGTGAEVVVVGTPTDLSRVLGPASSGDGGGWSAGAPVVRATYAVEEREGGGGLGAMLDAWFAEKRREMDAAAKAAEN